MVLILITIMLIIFKMYLPTNFITYDSNVAGSFSKLRSCSDDRNAHAQ